jgi:putative component of membrane protein insertase Oxa1/YidC/SpoIIIJ protein YidD
MKHNPVLYFIADAAGNTCRIEVHCAYQAISTAIPTSATVAILKRILRDRAFAVELVGGN